MAKKKKTNVGSRKSSRGHSDNKARKIFTAVAVALVVLALCFVLLVRRGDDVSRAENIAGSVLSPLQNAFTSATNYVVNFIENWRNYNQLTQEYNALKRENVALQLEISSYAEDVAENQRLSVLLGARDRYASLDPVYAKVIARDPGIWFDVFTINAGEAQGISKDMAVVTGDGLVGCVIEAGATYAKVRTIIDSRSAAACIVQRTRDNGVLRGVTTESYTSAACYVYYLPTTNSVSVGDIVITSGMDELYPKGLPIGTVSAVSRNNESTENYIVVSPYTDFQHIEDVLVLRTTAEKDTSSKVALPTPTPVPTKEPSSLILNTPTPVPTLEPDSDESLFFYPTPAPDPADMLNVEKGWAEGEKH